MSNARQLNPLIGEKNGMHGKHWYYNPETNESKPFVENEQSNGWILGLDPITSKNISKRLPHKNTLGKIKIYNSSTDTICYILPDEPMPEGFRKGGRPLSTTGKQKISEFYKQKQRKNIHYIQRD